jgi:phosphate acetyltransferase
MLSTKPYEVPPYLQTLCKTVPAVTTAICGADHQVALESARQATVEGLIKPILVGDGDAIIKIARDIDWDIGRIQIIDEPGEDKAPAATTALARAGDVGAIMKGHVHTDALMGAIVNRDTGLRTGRRLSHIFHMTIPGRERVLMISDGAVNVAPDVKTKIDITKNAVDLAHALGNTSPKVAMLSGTESILPAMPSSGEAREVIKHLQDTDIKNAHIDGPFAFDNALSPDAAALKGMSGPVAGNADILVVPNIETGNSLFKMMAYFMSATAAGIVMGATVPVMLTSRADPPEARVAAAALAALVAAEGTETN